MVQRVTASADNPEGTKLYRLGGISALIFGVAYVLIVGLFVAAGKKPVGAEAWLAHLAGNTVVWWTIVALSVLTDFLLIPVALALYFALRLINRNAMLVAVAFMGLFIILDLALTWPNIAALITLSGNYAAAEDNTQRVSVTLTATYPAAVADSTLLFVYNSLTLAIGILVSGWVMLRSGFGRAAAYLGLATGILGIVAVFGPVFISALASTIILVSVLTTIWIFLVGYKLYRMNEP